MAVLPGHGERPRVVMVSRGLPGFPLAAIAVGNIHQTAAADKVLRREEEGDGGGSGRGEDGRRGEERSGSRVEAAFIEGRSLRAK